MPKNVITKGDQFITLPDGLAEGKKRIKTSGRIFY